MKCTNCQRELEKDNAYCIVCEEEMFFEVELVKLTIEEELKQE